MPPDQRGWQMASIPREQMELVCAVLVATWSQNNAAGQGKVSAFELPLVWATTYGKLDC